uniref:Apple domain-containing protein n=1 Tax=Heliothis virescens TaxID=7102 RepID=A0A2A4J736_HELVI
MTKPIEAFDLRRDFVEDKDFDFFELDRNSLEPNCPDTLRGPGVLHSGFLSSKPNRIPDGDGASSGWRDRYDSFDGRHRDRFEGDRRGTYGNRRYEDRFFVPYRINQGLARSNEDQENWGKYGGEYGGYESYYKDRNDYHKSISHWQISSDVEPPIYGVKPHSNSKFDYHSLGKNGGAWIGNRYGYGAWKRGRWNSGTSANGLDFEDTSFFKGKSHHESIDRSDDGRTKDCSSRRRPGMSLGTGAIRRALISRNVVECEAACFSEREFKCVSYSYRYSNSHGTDNCFLSERPYRGLELAADSSSDVYAMPQDQGCVTINYKPWVESECFWHVRSGAAVSDTAIRAALTVGGLGACEAECIRAHAFFCRGFSFRFDSPTIGDDLENCILTSSPPTSLESGRGLRPNSGHELYARGNYGRGCEPALYDDVQHRDEECYLQYDKAARLTGAAVRGQARVKDEQACGHACNDAPFRCLSFSFNNNAPPKTDNCLLSEIRLFDLQRGVDYVHSADDWLFAFDLFNGQCWRKVHVGDYDEPAPEIPRPLSSPPIEDPYSLSGPSGPPGLPASTGLSGPSAPSGPGYLPEHDNEPPFIPASGPPSGPGFKPYSPGSEPPIYKPGYPEPSGPGYKPNYLPGSHKPYPEPEPGFKPGYPGPSLKPGYSGPSGPTFESDYPGPISPSFKPVYPSKPGYSDEPSGPSFKPGYLPDPDLKPGFRPSAPPQRPVYRPISDSPEYLPEKPGYLPDRRPGYPGPSRPVYNEPRPTRPVRPIVKPGYPDRVDNEPISVSWRHYTVSGFPCRSGTACAQNTVAGHWACEPEGGEIGSWDYCCAPTHRCGYSEGFHKPWCYVGPNNDQWRPCSEKYYPYHQHKVPHPSQAHLHGSGHQFAPGNRGLSGPPGPYLSEGDRKYWDDLYKNGPQAYYDKYGNPLPGYSRVPTESRPYIKLSHNYPQPGGGNWLPVSPSHEPDGPPPTGLGVPRYWPVAYLHKGPPPNTTYFRYNETQRPTTTTERYSTPPEPTTMPPRSTTDKHRDEKKYNMSDYDDISTTTFKPTVKTTTITPSTTELPEVIQPVTENITEVEIVKPENVKIKDTIKGIDDKLDDFSSSIEVLDLDDVKGDKISDLKTLEAEERQIEEIGRILASRRGGKLVLDKRSQKDLEAKSIAVDKDLIDFNFGNRFNVERRGVIQKVSKDEIERERGLDKSLEVSETSFVRPPRVLSTTENIRKAVVNGKVFYDATIREQRDTFFNNSTRKSKSLRTGDESKITNLTSSASFGKKIIKPRNVNPVRRVRRVYRKRYNPEEVRRRLLEREKSKQEISTENSGKI